jgi:hypothetical protein
MTALESAYKAGLLTKEEYDAKRQTLLAASATPAAAVTSAPLVTPPQPVTPAPPTPAASARKALPAPAVEVEKKVQQTENREGPALAAGCEDEQFKSGGQKSDTRFYAASPDAVRRAAVSALDALDFNVNKNTAKEIEAQKRRHIGVVIGAGGEKVKLTLKKAEEGGRSGTLVTGETKKNFVGRLAQRSWTDAVLAQTACKLREVN